MKSREISQSKIGPFSLAYTDPYIGIGWEYQSKPWATRDERNDVSTVKVLLDRSVYIWYVCWKQ